MWANVYICWPARLRLLSSGNTDRARARLAMHDADRRRAAGAAALCHGEGQVAERYFSETNLSTSSE